MKFLAPSFPWSGIGCCEDFGNESADRSLLLLCVTLLSCASGIIYMGAGSGLDALPLIQLLVNGQGNTVEDGPSV